MRAPSPQIKLVDEPAPFGDVALGPSALTGRSEAELARAMAAHLVAATPTSSAEALKSLRAAFPDTALTTRLAALSGLMRR